MSQGQRHILLAVIHICPSPLVEIIPYIQFEIGQLDSFEFFDLDENIHRHGWNDLQIVHLNPVTFSLLCWVVTLCRRYVSQSTLTSQKSPTVHLSNELDYHSHRSELTLRSGIRYKETLDKLVGPLWPRITPRLFGSAITGFLQQSDAWSALLLVALWLGCRREESTQDELPVLWWCSVPNSVPPPVSRLHSCLCQTLMSYTRTGVLHLCVYVNMYPHLQSFSSVLLILCIFVVSLIPVVCSLVQFNYAWCSSLVWSFIQLHISQSAILYESYL